MSILKEMMPVCDASRAEQRIVDAPIAVVYQTALCTDFLDAVRHNAIVKTLIVVRSAVERLVSVIRRRPFSEPREPPALRLEELPSRGEWVRLGEEPPIEIAFGAIGRFWSGETRWAEIERDQFAHFSTPGYAKVVCNLFLTSIVGGRTLLVYEACTRATDDASRRSFLRYWRVVSPFVGIIMRATLAIIERNVGFGAPTISADGSAARLRRRYAS